MINGSRQVFRHCVLIGVLLVVFCTPMVGQAQPDQSEVATSQGSPSRDGGEEEKRNLTVRAPSRSQLVLELLVPRFDVQEVLLNGETFVTIAAPGLDDSAEPGMPRLPQTGVLVGLPPEGGWSAHVLEAERTVVSLPTKLAPAPGIAPTQTGAQVAQVQAKPSWSLDAQAYGAQEFFPVSLISQGDVTLLRDLRIARLGLHPFRYNPAQGTIEHIRRLVIQVDFDEPAAGTLPAEDRWDPIIQRAVINYDQARAWRGVRPAVPEVEVNPQAGTPGSFKVEVDQDGLYQLGYADLASAGFPVGSTRAENIHLMVGGQETALQVEAGLDGYITPGDRILFYGQAMSGRFTRTNVYWLYADETPGARMSTRSVIPNDVYPTPLARWITERFEENHLYDGIRPEADGDHWYWMDLAFLQTECWKGEALTQEFELPHLWTGAHSATIRIGLQGYTWGRHSIGAWINGNQVGNIVWSHEDRIDGQFTFPAAWLRQGTNALVLENSECPPKPPPAPPPNGMLLSYFELEHLANYRALGGQLAFQGEVGLRQYEVDGFSTSNLVLVDITDPLAPTVMFGARVEANSRIVFQDETAQRRQYLAAAHGEIHAPKAFYRDVPSSLGSTFAGADYLLISHKSFLSAVQPLLARRTAQGMIVMAADVQDVYDEFNFGVFDPTALRYFLAFVSAEWNPLPTYVLLVGDGTIDFHNYMGNGWRNYIPAYPAYVDLRLAPVPVEAATDNDLDPSPDLPTFLMGRLPVVSPDEAKAVVSKILSYEQSPPEGSWNRHLLFVADDDDPSGPFTDYSHQVYKEVAYPLTAGEVHLSRAPEPEPHEYNADDSQRLEAARQVVASRFRSGQLMVTYMGHSSFSQWAQEILLHRDDVPSLTNGGRLPIVLSMTCYTSAFHHPIYDPLDERLVLEPNGGAIATWGATGAGVATGHRHLARGFLDAVQGSGGRGKSTDDLDPTLLGEAVYSGLARLYVEAPTNRDLIDTYILFGDPAMSINRYTGDAYTANVPLVAK